MARETKAQREAREATEAAARRHQETHEYFPKLMEVLERATKNDMELSVVSGHFHVRRPGEGDAWAFPTEHTDVASNLLWELNYELDLREEEKREEERRYLVRVQALAKLTKEEKELLGL